MDSARWQKIQTLFHRAAEQPKELQRSFLEAECGTGAAELVSNVVAMLEEDARSSSPLDRDLAGYAGRIVGPLHCHRKSDRIASAGCSARAAWAWST